MTAKNHRKPGFEIRKAIESDIPVLVTFMAKLALHVSGSEPQKLKEEEHQRLADALRASLKDDNKHLIVAETADEGPIGMGYVYVWRSQGIWEQTEPVEYRSGFIDDVWVEPEFRNRGVFKALLKDLVAFAESHHAHELILEYSATNKQAKAAWTRMGFKTAGVRAAAFTSTVREALE